MKHYINKETLMNLLYISKSEIVVKSDIADLPTPGLLFLDETSVEGNIKIEMLNGGIVTIAFQKGVIHPFIVKKVFATGTTATNIFINPISQ